MKARFKSLIYCLIIPFLLAWAPPVSAQSTALSITPPVVEILLSPNKKIIQAFTIKNQAESGQFVANLHAVMPIDSVGHVVVSPTPLDPTSTPLLLSLQNINLTFNTPFELRAGESQQLVLSIAGSNTDVPIDTYFALVVSTYSPTNTSLSSTVPGISALILITLTPDGNLPISLSLTDFNPPVIHDSFTPLALQPVLHNQTTTMLRPEGKLEVISPRGQTLVSLPLYPNLILGSSTRTITAQLGEPGSPNLRESPLTWSPSPFTLGPYRLRLTISTLGGTTISETERTVWLLPLRLLLFFLILLLSFLAIFLARRHQKSSRPTPT